MRASHDDDDDDDDGDDDVGDDERKVRTRARSIVCLFVCVLTRSVVYRISRLVIGWMTTDRTDG